MPGFVSRNFVFKTVIGLHRTVFNLTNGRILGRLGGMPVLMLTTTGRKSGEPRTTMLTTPVKKEGSPVVVASFGGSDHHPDWFLNLRDDPKVEVVIDGYREKRSARVATPDEKKQLWPQVTKAYEGYAGYQEKTDRDIPLVILEPASEHLDA